MLLQNLKIAIIGLGYVGLPLAIEFGKKFKVLGFDIDQNRINELNSLIDRTNEADLVGMKYAMELVKTDDSKGLSFSANNDELKNNNVFIVTVPTPINQFKAPDLTPLLKASEMIGKIIKKGDIIIYESTVYPGCTEEDCVPVLEKFSGLKFNVDFFCGYSPERINPGDKVNTLTKIKKVTSGSTPEIAEIVDSLYKSIIQAGTHKAPSLKVAEASKAIENAQRDVNISFVNELALIFDRMGIDTNDVLEAAGTKWNFLKYKPGLVGGHCIGVDPYYLAHKAESLGYHPQVILSGRRVNDNMGMFVANKLVKLLIAKNHVIAKSNVLVLGITFKENCPDIRNSKVIDIVRELEQFNINVEVFDPHADKQEVVEEYGINLIDSIKSAYDGIILAVAHQEFLELELDQLKSSDSSVLFDTKAFLDRSIIDARL
ncbi:MAG: nucleotide sugar dehydrogenase [Sediminibacterium sp.]|jgi:UDP-N-acetyl-D-glucosamine/UDP-N-acetyl-D-galactosamine dehydrogenase|uniref:nucleotide sugar dehydrogenase n=1 Tax=Sediminibacterium sp. TaxID=1917865 RepID=UPI002ABD04B9|nr:nucleotide sugar dehydrogenase [Sediminibacterium sp.]MDZ4070748.1 nucleotide sugar dehydrogenase [Sediminibacterium sp.]